MAANWFIGRVLTGFEEPEGRRWTIFIPAEALEHEFGTRDVPEQVVNEWAEKDGADVFRRAVVRTLSRDEEAREAYVDIDDL